MLDLDSEFRLFANEVRDAVLTVLESQQFVNGPAVGALEDAIAERIGTSHAVAVSSGTDALLCAMMALGIGAGDEVIVPSFTFFATAGSVARTGATPVFVDIDPRTFNMDPASVASAVTDRTRAICVVHLFGQCAEMNALRAVADQHGLKIIEDAAQALGATHRGKQVGTLGDVACVSFYPTKNLGGFGEGGMILTSDAGLADVARQLRNHGASSAYVHERIGGNFRLDTLKAAVLLVKLRYWEDFTERRRSNAARYDELLVDSGVTTPHVAEGQRAVYHQYSILCDRRDDLRAFLGDRGVQTGVYYPVPLHRQPCFSHLGYAAGALPVCERVSGQILSLPCHPMLTDEDLTYTAACIREFSGTCSGGWPMSFGHGGPDEIRKAVPTSIIGSPTSKGGGPPDGLKADR